VGIKSGSDNLAAAKAAGTIAPTSTVGAPPIMPAAGGSNDFSRGQTPSAYSSVVDQLRTSETNAIPSERIPPAPALANQQANSSAAQSATVVVQTVTNTVNEVVSLQVNGIPNSEQDKLNIINGTNTTVVADPGGAVQINVPTMGANYQLVEQATVAKPGEPTMNFLSPMTATDNPGNTSTDIAISVMVGDSGSGGIAGLAPAPPSGSFAAGKFLNAGGGYTIPPGTGGAAFYQTAELATVAKTQRAALNFLAGMFTLTDNSGNSSTDVGWSPNNVFSEVLLTGTVSISTISTTLATVGTTVPANGAQFRIRASYSIYLNTGNTTTVNAWVSDGTNAWASSQVNGANSVNTGISTSGVSSAVYSAGSSVTITLKIVSSGSGCIVEGSPFAGVGKNSVFQIEIFQSN
jgi:hypothetical protein